METLEALDRLTQPWSHLFGPAELGANTYQRVEYPPLFDSLRNAISSSLGGTTSGATPAHTRNVFNVRAFEMWEHIDGVVRAWGRDLKVVSSPDLKVVLRRVYVANLAAHELGRVRRNFDPTVRGWVQQISDLFDPPVVKELNGDCPAPNCGQRFVLSADGELQSALIAYYRSGVEPEAKCRSCGVVWAGQRELLTLGFSIHATVDHEALKEMGVA